MNQSNYLLWTLLFQVLRLELAGLLDERSGPCRTPGSDGECFTRTVGGRSSLQEHWDQMIGYVTSTASPVVQWDMEGGRYSVLEGVEGGGGVEVDDDRGSRRAGP